MAKHSDQLEMWGCLGSIPAWTWFAVSNSFALFCGAVKGIVFFLNSVFLPKTAFQIDTLFTEE